MGRKYPMPHAVVNSVKGTMHMATLVRHEFVGSVILFWLLCVTIFGIPLAIVYLINGTIRIEHDMDDPEKFIEDFRTGKLEK